MGQDLGFVDNKSYADTNDSIKEDIIYKKVLSVSGDMISTNYGYMYFKRKIEKEIEEKQNVKFVNCGKGARIKGTVELELEKIL